MRFFCNSDSMPKVTISGLGNFLPNRIVTSSELDQQLGLSSGSVLKKSGLISRHFASPHETTSYMGAQAALSALKHAQIDLASIDAIVAACGVPEQAIPCTASLIQKQLGLEHSGIPCFDVNATCLSFINALDVSSYLIEGGRFQRILIISSDIPSLGLNWNDLDTCTIFGDGAAACVLEKSHGTDTSRILASHMETYSLGSEYCYVAAAGTRYPPTIDYDQQLNLFTMDGKKVFKLASQIIEPMHETLFAKAGVTMSDISWVVPHQASLLAMHHIRKRLNIPEEQFLNIFATHGNQIAASIPTTLSHAVHQHRIERGQLVYLLGTGAGISAAGMILEY